MATISTITPLSNLELEIVRLNFERAIVLDSDGELMIVKDGTNINVDFTDCEFEQIEKAGATFIHNHPAGLDFDKNDPRHLENGLSRSDWLFAISARLDKMIALSPGFRYTISRNGAEWSESYALSQGLAAFEIAERKVTAKFKKKIKAALAESGVQAYYDAIAFCDAHHNHEVSILVSKDLKISYLKEAIA